MLLRGLVCAGGKVLIAPAAASALGNNHALIRVRKILKTLTGFVIVNNGSDGNFEYDAFAVAASAVGAFAVASALAFVFRVEAKMDERIVALTGLHDDIPAPATVAAGRTAARDKLLPAKGHAPVATVAGLNPDNCFINKHAIYIDCTGQGADSPQRESPAQSGAQRQTRRDQPSF